MTLPDAKEVDGDVVAQLRLLADADLREIARDIPVMGLKIDAAELHRWADAMEAGADLIERLRLSQASVPVPDGWKLVPVEPTPDMTAAWWSYKNGFHFADEPPPPDCSDYGAYRAMLTAAPPPPTTSPNGAADYLRTQIQRALAEMKDEGHEWAEERLSAALRICDEKYPTTSLSVALAEERERCRFALERCKAYLATRANVMGEQPAEERLLAREIDAALGPARGTE